MILMGKDQAAAYHLAVVVDDAAQNISHVIRGVDLAPATALHRVLQLLLGLPAPIYHHHHLILDAAGEKLSKSKSSMSLRDMREMGVSADTLLDGFAAGLDRMNAFLPTEEN